MIGKETNTVNYILFQKVELKSARNDAMDKYFL